MAQRPKGQAHLLAAGYGISVEFMQVSEIGCMTNSPKVRGAEGPKKWHGLGHTNRHTCQPNDQIQSCAGSSPGWFLETENCTCTSNKSSLRNCTLHLASLINNKSTGRGGVTGHLKVKAERLPGCQPCHYLLACCHPPRPSASQPQPSSRAKVFGL